MAKELFDAITRGDPQQVAELLQGDPALANARNTVGVSAILQARYEGQRAIVSLLRKSVGELDLFEAAALGDVERLLALLASTPHCVNDYSQDGFTPLHLACFFGQRQAAQELLRHGADANAISRNSMRVGVVNSAAASGEAEMVKLVLAGGARPDNQQVGGWTALHAAAARDNVEMVLALLAAGADSTIRSDDGKTAADKGGPETASLLASRSKGATQG